MATTKRQRITEKLEFDYVILGLLREAYKALITGQVQSYTIGSRSLTRLNLPDLKNEIREIETEVDGLEEQLRSGGKARKAVGVVPRDF